MSPERVPLVGRRALKPLRGFGEGLTVGVEQQEREMRLMGRSPQVGAETSWVGSHSVRLGWFRLG